MPKPQQTTQDLRAASYKGSLIERRWLTSWEIPHIDLEPLGCPKFDHLPRLSTEGSCGHHHDPLHHHCLQVKCYHFVQWMMDS